MFILADPITQTVFLHKKGSRGNTTHKTINTLDTYKSDTSRLEMQVTR